MLPSMYVSIPERRGEEGGERGRDLQRYEVSNEEPRKRQSRNRTSRLQEGGSGNQAQEASERYL